MKKLFPRNEVGNLNGLIYAKPKENNIFEERFKQYIQLQDTIVKMLKDMNYTVKNISYLVSDPSNPTYSYVLEAVHNDKLEDGSEKTVNLLVPIPDRNITFVVNGIRWIPVFQITDLPVFKKVIRLANNSTTAIILQNTYGLLILDTELAYYKVNKNFWPVFLLMVEIEKSYETVLDNLQVEYTIESEKKDSGVNVPICDGTYINITTQNPKILRMLTPFINQSDELDKYEENIMEYATVEETFGKILNAWKVETKNKNVIKAMSIIDNVMVPNGLFEGPFRAIDVLYYILTTNYVLKHRDINDITARRIRLGEWMLYKLSQQHKKNILEDTTNVFSNAILDVLSTDQRRILDDSVNPLGELCLMSRIIYNGLGGINKESCSPTLRNLHDSYYGVIDPIDTPTGDAIGICQHIVPETILVNGNLKNIAEVQ